MITNVVRLAQRRGIGMQIFFYDSQLGITLVEVLVTLVISTVGLLGVSAFLIKVNQSVTDAGNRTQALWILEDLGSRMRANAHVAHLYVTEGRYGCPAAVKPCGTSLETLAAICTKEEMVAFDLWDVVCDPGVEQEGRIRLSNAASFMVDPKLEITHDNALFILHLSWIARGYDYQKKTGSNTSIEPSRDAVEMKIRP